MVAPNALHEPTGRVLLSQQNGWTAWLCLGIGRSEAGPGRAAPLFFPLPRVRRREEPVMTEPRDHAPATLGRGHLRACHADREQVIGVLKAAFVQGRLGKTS